MEDHLESTAVTFLWIISALVGNFQPIFNCETSWIFFGKWLHFVFSQCTITPFESIAYDSFKNFNYKATICCSNLFVHPMKWKHDYWTKMQCFLILLVIIPFEEVLGKLGPICLQTLRTASDLLRTAWLTSWSSQIQFVLTIHWKVRQNFDPPQFWTQFCTFQRLNSYFYFCEVGRGKGGLEARMTGLLGADTK